MALNFIKRTVDVVKKNDKSLKYLLHKKLGHYEEARPHKIIHASELTKPDFCAREFCLSDLTGKKQTGQYIITSLQVTFDLGCALQDMLNQNWGVDWCIGTWKCKHCGKIYPFQKRPKVCISEFSFGDETYPCEHKEFEYIEERFIHPKYNFSGSVDFIFAPTPNPPFKLIEVKTIVKDDFKKLVAPLAEHRLRTTLYLELARYDKKRSKFLNDDEASILYICKGYGVKDNSLVDMGIKDGGFSPFKEFTIKRNFELVAPIIEKARQVWDFNNNGGPLPERICPTSFCKRAKYCNLRKACWTGEYSN